MQAKLGVYIGLKGSQQMEAWPVRSEASVRAQKASTETSYEESFNAHWYTQRLLTPLSESKL